MKISRPLGKHTFVRIHAVDTAAPCSFVDSMPFDWVFLATFVKLYRKVGSKNINFYSYNVTDTFFFRNKT
jgi:hypothetical protein